MEAGELRRSSACPSLLITVTDSGMGEPRAWVSWRELKSFRVVKDRVHDGRYAPAVRQPAILIDGISSVAHRSKVRTTHCVLNNDLSVVEQRTAKLRR